MNKIDQIAIGALLHDIGKFSQRARVQNKFLKDDTEKQRVCKTDRFGNFSLHSLYTSLFMKENKKYFPDINEYFKKPNDDNYINFASCHHNPQTEIGKIITIADMLSNGMDRVDLEIEEEDKIDFRKERLISVFSEIKLTVEDDGSKTSNKNSLDAGIKYVHHICPLDYSVESTDQLLPYKETTKEDLSEEYLIKEYLINWLKFVEEFQIIKKQNSTKFFYRLKYLLEKYTWCIPSSTINLQDISLYDHLYTTASIAVSLYQYHDAVGFSEKEINNKDTNKFLLISGDLSGIQKYIYNIFGNSSKGTAKILRSRSMYLELLNEMSSRYLIEKLNLHPVNLFYCTGGKFLMIAPNTGNVKENLTEAETELSKWYLNQFKGELSLNIASLELSGQDLNIKNFVNKYRELIGKTEFKKKNKFSTVFFNNSSTDEYIIENDFSKYENGACRFCGKEPADTNKEEDEGLGSFCKILKKIGELLPFIHYIAFLKNAIPKNLEKIPYLEFFNKKYFVFFFKENERINEDDFSEIYSLKSDKNFPLKLISGYIPSDESGPLSFEDISEKSCSNSSFNALNTYSDGGDSSAHNDGIGQKFLGVLRADVDNMGFIFSLGFEDGNLKKSKLSISRYFSLSRMFNLFFNGFLKNSISCEQSFKDIYTVYSGGDDLFLVGPWDTMVDFTMFMGKSFKSYTCNNENITISAALGLFKPSYPVKRFAAKTEEMLEKAKQNMSNDSEIKEKLHGNKVTIFGKSVYWDDFEKLIAEGIFLEQELKKNKNNNSSKITSSFIYRLLTYYRMYEIFKDTGQAEMLKYKSLLNYDIARNIVEKEGEKIKNDKLVRKVMELVFKEEKFKNILIPLTWATYRTRKTN
ncbi:MAG: type III-A CRISPR-associated protein Cas10/Csm1 [Candidatus Humimicrobiaceae bacterium]